MEYRVEITTYAKRDLRQAYDHIARDSVRNANRWYDRMMAMIESLRFEPEGWPVAPDAETFPDHVVRQKLFGKRRGVFRILFAVDGDRVVVHRIMHSARRLLNEPGDPDD